MDYGISAFCRNGALADVVIEREVLKIERDRRDAVFREVDDLRREPDLEFEGDGSCEAIGEGDDIFAPGVARIDDGEAMA